MERILMFVVLTLWPAIPCTAAAEEPQRVETRFRVNGLFCLEREKDLRSLFATLPQFEVVKVDHDAAEVTLRYDPEKAFPNKQPDKAVEQLDSMLMQGSNHTFGCRPLSTIAPEKLMSVEIAVSGLDCQACSYAAYRAISTLPGVEQATASFREGKVTAKIDPEKTSRAALEMALTQRGVKLAAESK